MKKVLSILLAVAMIIAMVPAAFAAETVSLENGVSKDITIHVGGSVDVVVDATESDMELSVAPNRTYMDWAIKLGEETYYPYASGAQLIELAAGQKYTLTIENTSEDTDQVVTVVANKPAVGTADKPDSLILGTNSVELAASQEYYYSWTAPSAGKLTIAVADTCDDWYFSLSIGYSSDMWGTGDDETRTFTVAEGDEITLSVSTWSWDAGTVTFDASFVADSGSEEPEWTVYKNEITPDPTYSLIINEYWNETLVDLDVVNNAYTVAVDEDGYYHLDSVSGPVVLVNFNDDDLSINEMLAGRHTFRTAVYGEGLTVLEQIDFTEAVDAYIACADQGYYPLTTDLAYMLQTYGLNQGLWGEVLPENFRNPLFNVDAGDDVWLFACAYVQDCTHENLQRWDALAPTCHDDGNVEYWTCPDCHCYWLDEDLTQVTNSKNIIDPALGSDEVVHVEAVAPTCEENGNVEYWYCPECDRYFLDEACTQLSNSKSVVLGALNHCNAQHIEAQDPTCHDEGNNEYWYCPDCNRYFADEDCQIPEAASRFVIAPLGSENVIHFEALEPTCHDEGNVEYWYCPDCNRYFADEACQIPEAASRFMIAPLGSENVKHVEAVAPTCEENGNNEYWYCPDCGRYFADEACQIVTPVQRMMIPATGHNYEWVIDKEATANEAGSKHEECTICHDKKDAVAIPATGTVQTGDTSMLGLWIALLVVSGSGVIAITFFARKRNRSGR